jgi:hypothetical protein
MAEKAWEDFIYLIDSVEERNFPDKLWIANLPEVNEHNLDGFEMSDRDKKKTRAEENETMLTHFADRMAGVYGERPIVPYWARANVKVPEYYT